ncbi:glycine-rich domain-containing protein [Actinomadura litoris]|uniref:glycine-rich domain-containing protein n=1 Tax=Actinomadura litoris TaxID=2678616 RepID=UPI001FA7B325|nr:hypothetical protein [Actinomadura litoris]
MTVMIQAASTADPRGMIPAELFDKVAARTAAEHKMPRELADRSLLQTLTMLRAIAEHPGTTLHPPKVIDYSWHMLILHTADYMAMCERLAGHYLHHTPADGATDGGANVQASADTLRSLGYEIDDELWAMIDATNCENACSGCDNKVPS